MLFFFSFFSFRFRKTFFSNLILVLATDYWWAYPPRLTVSWVSRVQNLRITMERGSMNRSENHYEFKESNKKWRVGCLTSHAKTGTWSRLVRNSKRQFWAKTLRWSLLLWLRFDSWSWSDCPFGGRMYMCLRVKMNNGIHAWNEKKKLVSVSKRSYRDKICGFQIKTYQSDACHHHKIKIQCKFYGAIYGSLS